MPVERSTVHHEGAGAPATKANAGRCADGGYSYAICSDGWVRFRAPQNSWATLNFNHVSLDIVLTGNRMDHPVTDADITAIHGAFMDSFNRGEVVGLPQVVAHKNSPGSSTVCPGDRTMARWNDVARAVSNTTPAPQPPPAEEDDVTDLANAINHDGRPAVFQVGGDARLYYRVRNPTGGTWGNWTDLSSGKTGFATVTAWNNADSKKIEVWVTMKDGKTWQRWQTDDFAGWVAWTDRTR